MKLRFIGTGAAFYPALGNTSAFFTRGDDLFLIDCGEMIFSRIRHADLLTRYPGRVTVLVTHLHADHVGSLSSLIAYCVQVLGRPVTLLYPSEDIRALLRLMGMTEEHYTLLDEYAEDGLRMTPIAACHAPEIPAYAYLLTDEDGTIYYSGDNGELLPAILDGIRQGEILHAYQDTNWFEQPPHAPFHLPLQTLMAQVKPELRDRFTLMHFNRDFRDEAMRAGFACAEPDLLFAHE